MYCTVLALIVFVIWPSQLNCFGSLFGEVCCQMFIGSNKSILWKSSTTVCSLLQPFTGFMTVVIIFTNVRFHGLPTAMRAYNAERWKCWATELVVVAQVWRSSRSTHGAATASTRLYCHEVCLPASLPAYVATPERDAK